MSDDPFRLAVLKNLTTLLETINRENGYSHDLLGQVHRGRTRFGEKDRLPAISILEVPTPAELLADPGPDAPATYGPWPLLLQGWVDDDLRNPLDPAYHLEADVRMCLAKHKKANSRAPYNLLGMKGKVTALHLGLGTARPPLEGVSSNAFFWMVLTPHIAEQLDDPYGWDK